MKDRVQHAIRNRLTEGFSGTPAQWQAELLRAGHEFEYQSVWQSLRALQLKGEIRAEKVSHITLYGPLNGAR